MRVRIDATHTGAPSVKPFKATIYDPYAKPSFNPWIVNNQSKFDNAPNVNIIDTVAPNPAGKTYYKMDIQYGPHIVYHMGFFDYQYQAYVLDDAYGTVINQTKSIVNFELPTRADHAAVVLAMHDFSNLFDSTGVVLGKRAAVEAAEGVGAKGLTVLKWAHVLAHKFEPSFNAADKVIVHAVTGLDKKLAHSLNKAILVHQGAKNQQELLQGLTDTVNEFQASLIADEKNALNKLTLGNVGSINPGDDLIEGIIGELESEGQTQSSPGGSPNSLNTSPGKWPEQRLEFLKAAVQLEARWENYGTDHTQLTNLHTDVVSLFQRLSDFTHLASASPPKPESGAAYFSELQTHLQAEMAEAKLIGSSLSKLGSDLREHAAKYPVEMIHEYLNNNRGLDVGTYHTGLDQKARTFDEGLHVALVDFYKQSRLEMIHLQNDIETAMDVQHKKESAELLNEVLAIITGIVSFGLGIGSMAGAGLSLLADLKTGKLHNGGFLSDKGYAEWTKAATGLGAFGSALTLEGSNFLKMITTPPSTSTSTFTRQFTLEGQAIPGDKYGLENLTDASVDRQAQQTAVNAEHEAQAQVQAWGKAVANLALSIGQGYETPTGFDITAENRNWGWKSSNPGLMDTGGYRAVLNGNGHYDHMRDVIKAEITEHWNAHAGQVYSDEWYRHVTVDGYNAYGRIYVNVHTETIGGQAALAGIGITYHNPGSGGEWLGIMDGHMFI